MAKFKKLPSVPSMVVNPLSIEKSGCKLIDDCKLPIGFTTITPIQFLEKGENCADAFKRINQYSRDIAGQFYAELILAQQKNIPVEWQPFFFIFAGDRWFAEDGSGYVIYLCYDHDKSMWFSDWVNIKQEVIDPNSFLMRIYV